MNTVYSLIVFGGLLFLLLGGASVMVLAEKWNWLSREDRNIMLIGALVSFSLAIICFIKLLTLPA